MFYFSPVREEHPRPDLRHPGHAQRAPVHRRQQAGLATRSRTQGGGRPGQEALEVRICRVLGETQLARGAAVQGVDQGPGLCGLRTEAVVVQLAEVRGVACS